MFRNSINNEPCVRVFALGGLDESGKNMYCIETVDSIFVIEAGLKYPDISNPGVDYIIPEMDYLKNRASKIKAVIISHAHDDEYGALPYFLKKVANVPIYTTETVKNFVLADYQKRYGSLFHFHIIKPSDDLMISGYPFHFFETSHTVAESFGFSVDTPAGSIVYTGDYISDFSATGHFKFDLSKIAKVAEEHKTLLMMAESAGADKPGIVSPTHKLTPHIRSFIEDGEHRVIIACYTQNMYIINEVIQQVIKNHKKLVITNDRFLNMLPSFIANGDLIVPRANQCAISEMKNCKPEDLVVLMTGSGEELYNNIEDIARHEAKDQVLEFNENDVVILACPSVPTTEVKQVEMLDSLYQTGAKVVNLTHKDLSSMHAQEEDLKMLISIFKPKYYMPIEGPFRLMMANAKVANSVGYDPDSIFLMDNGMSLNFDAAGRPILPIQSLFTPGNVFVDGLGIGDVRSNIIDERTQMASSGVVVLSALYSSKKHSIIGEPQVKMPGFVLESSNESVKKVILQIFKDYLTQLIAMPEPDPVAVMQKCMKQISQEMQRQIHKDPLILPAVVDIDNPQSPDIKAAPATR